MKITNEFLLKESNESRVENYYIEPEIVNYLVNADPTGLDNNEIRLADDFAEELSTRSTHFTIDIIADSRGNFQESEITGMNGECYTVAIHLFDDNQNHVDEYAPEVNAVSDAF